MILSGRQAEKDKTKDNMVQNQNNARRIIPSIFVCIISLFYLFTADNVLAEITFSEPNLEECIRDKINKPTGELLTSDVQGITSLDCGWIQNLEVLYSTCGTLVGKDCQKATLVFATKEDRWQNCGLMMELW